MQDNLIGEEGAVALARALEHNSSITTLEVGVCEGRSRRRKWEKRTLVDTHLHAVQHNKKGGSCWVGAAVGAQQLYHRVIS